MRHNFLNKWLWENLHICSNAAQQLPPQINPCAVCMVLLVTEEYTTGCGCSVCLVWTSACFYLLGMVEDKHTAINIALKTWKIIQNVLFSFSAAELQQAKESVLCNMWPKSQSQKTPFPVHSWNKVSKTLISTAMHWNKMCGLQIKANLKKSRKWQTILARQQNDPVHPMHDPFPKPVTSPWCHVWSHIHVPHFTYFNLSLSYDRTV